LGVPARADHKTINLTEFKPYRGENAMPYESIRKKAWIGFFYLTLICFFCPAVASGAQLNDPFGSPVMVTYSASYQSDFITGTTYYSLPATAYVSVTATSDAPIADYRFDTNGDGLFDSTSSDGHVSYVVETPSRSPIWAKVIDANGNARYLPVGCPSGFPAFYSGCWFGGAVVPPVASISTQQVSGTAPLTVNYEIDGWPDPTWGGDIVSSTIDYNGDGVADQTLNYPETTLPYTASHTFTYGGRFNAIHTIYSDNGSWATDIQPVDVLFPDGATPLPTPDGNLIGLNVQGGVLSSAAVLNPNFYVTETTGMPADLPYGLLDLTVQTPNPGDEVQYTVYFPGVVASGYNWFKYTGDDGWQDFSGNAVFTQTNTAVLVTVTDGDKSLGDADGVADGVVRDPAGLGLGGGGGAAVPGTGGGGGAGGCFISSACSD